VNISARFVLILAFVFTSALSASARKRAETRRPATERKPDAAEIEAATRLEIFLDRANFSPGKLDGHYSDFTLRALAFYRQSRGEAPASPQKRDIAPDVNGLDLGSIGPVLISYTVTEADLQYVRPVPSSIREQAKLKALPYRDAAEAIAEKFHCDPKFSEQLNPGKTKNIKSGDLLQVPNVEPFDIASIRDSQPGSDIKPAVANEMPEEPEAQKDSSAGEKPNAVAEATPPGVNVKIDTKTNMLGVFEGEKIVAAYPVTVGSGQTTSPIGEWKIRGIVKLPTFRYDERMFKRGERSKNFHLLPPGPNNLVGVMWIALNKKGIGIHGTSEPDTIGHSVSHGCIRLANWDVVRFAAKIKPGVPVSVD
jgi:lipoprotein-anchoring transpeptidase ErfK/SrfK